MTGITVIRPELISGNDNQTISADLTKFDVAKQQCELTVQELNRFLKISTQESCKEAQEVLKIASTIIKAIENKRTSFVKPWNDEVKKVNGHFISIWHNHSLSNQNEWAGLREIHDAIAEYAATANSN